MNLTTKKISSFHFLALEILALQQTTFVMVTCFGRGGFGNVYKVTTIIFQHNTSVVRNFRHFLNDEIMQGICCPITKKLQSKDLVRVLDKGQRNSEMKLF